MRERRIVDPVSLSAGADHTDRRWRPFLERSWLIVVSALLLLPLLATSVWLFGDRWAPVFDMAFIEMRVRDIGTVNSPLIGLGGRLGRAPNFGSHPGPLAFYLLAPAYWLLGSSYWALRTSGLISNAAAILTSLVMVRRLQGDQGVVALGVGIALVEIGLGLPTFAEPWNPYFPVLWFFAFLVLVSSVLAGHEKLLPAVAGVGSLCGQTHISYLPACGGLSALAFLVVFGRWLGARQSRSPSRELGAACLWTVATAAVLWAPPVLDEATHEPGNLTILYRYFKAPPEPSVGFHAAARLLLNHMDVWSFCRESFRTPGLYRGPLDGPQSTWFGALVLAAWALAAAVALGRSDRTLRAGHTTILAALPLALLAISRIIGAPIIYLLFFAWCLAGFVLYSLYSTALSLLRATGPLSPWAERCATGAGAAFILACSVRLTGVVKQTGSILPTARVLAAVAPRAAAAIKSAAETGARGPYVVTWEDALSGGAVAFGLLAELDRRGIRAFVSDNEQSRSFVGAHRVIDPKKAGARIHIVNGGWIDDARAMRGARQIAYADIRTETEREQYAGAVAIVTRALLRTGHPEAVSAIDHALSQACLPSLDAWEQLACARIMEIGLPVAVFALPVDKG